VVRRHRLRRLTCEPKLQMKCSGGKRDQDGRNATTVVPTEVVEIVVATGTTEIIENIEVTEAVKVTEKRRARGPWRGRGMTTGLKRKDGKNRRIKLTKRPLNVRSQGRRLLC